MALRHVADLVRHHGGQFRFGLGRHQQAGMDGDEAARQRERVERRVTHGEEEEIGVGLAARAGHRAHQRVAEVVQVFEDRVIIEVIVVAPDVAHDFLAQLALDDRRQILARGVAERGQLQVVVLLQRRGGDGAGQRCRSRNWQDSKHIAP